MCNNCVEQEASYITVSQCLTPAGGDSLAVSQERRRADPPLERESAADPEMTAVIRRVLSVKSLCYIMLCEAFCCVNTL